MTWRAVSLSLLIAFSASGAADERDRAKSASDAVYDRYGTTEKLNSEALEPMATERSMSTTDGSEFQTQVSCKASQAFMRLNMVPGSQGDLDRIFVEQDADLDGSIESSTILDGPYAAVCTNGIVQCDPGSYRNCDYFRWTTQNGVITTEEVAPYEVNACYCFNEHCGDNLFFVNRKRIAEDIGTGMARAFNREYPRLVLGRSQSSGETGLIYYGHQGNCSTDSQPEQYFGDMNALRAAGEDEAQKTDTIYHDLITSPAAQDRSLSELSCNKRRVFNLSHATKYEVITVESRNRGQTIDCGEGCVEFITGVAGNNYWSGDCGVKTNQANLRINDPSRITSAIVEYVVYDDFSRVWVGGEKIFDKWGGCDHNNSAGTRRINRDVTHLFTNANQGDVIDLVQVVRFRGRGEGWFNLRVEVDESCKIDSEHIDDTCSVIDNRDDCELFQEDIDDVRTVDNYRDTGLQPVPSPREVTGTCSAGYVVRPWWETQRTYRCETKEDPYDMTAAEERYRTIHESYDVDTGDFLDRRKTENGSYVTAPESLFQPDPTPEQPCVQLCQTRKRKPGSNVTETGTQSDNNASGTPWDYTYRECRTENVCPIEDGEELVLSCHCPDRFGQAASMMQSIRMMQQDFICTRRR